MTNTPLTKTRFYAIDLDARAIRAKPYTTERASSQDGNVVSLRGAHLMAHPLYVSFSILDEAGWTSRRPA